MSKKHFEAIAEALRTTRVTDQDQFEDDVKSIAWAIARFNPRFDRQRFLAACGLED